MKNKQLFVRDPTVSKLVNDGVAAVREAASPKEIETLRYELEHFVCEGQYEDGLIRILESYLGNVGSTTQPAGWVSGFYGSGKSHLLKMFRHLWVDTRFADGTTARGLARLPEEVQDLLHELDSLGKRSGGLHAASGTLPSGGGESVRLAVLSIMLASRGLPEVLPQAQFCMWLQKNGLLDRVKTAAKAAGKEFYSELHDLYVSPILAKAVLDADPSFAADLKQARAALVLAWAVGAGLLDRNPLLGYVPPAEASPRRPIVTASEYEALLAGSEPIHPLFRLALIVVHETGHRIGAVRQLRWADIDLEHQLVRWRAENDKIGYEHETWLTPTAVEALQTARRSRPVISEWVFAAPSDPAKPISRHLLRDWWQRGQALAKLPTELGRGWHSLRRQFATEMKSAPLKDLCALGGWKSPQTVLTCYQRADSASMQQALAARRRLEA